MAARVANKGFVESRDLSGGGSDPLGAGRGSLGGGGGGGGSRVEEMANEPPPPPPAPPSALDSLPELGPLGEQVTPT
eukprot:1389002-Prymnesium_polylepis.1